VVRRRRNGSGCLCIITLSIRPAPWSARRLFLGPFGFRLPAESPPPASFGLLHADDRRKVLTRSGLFFSSTQPPNSLPQSRLPVPPHHLRNGSKKHKVGVLTFPAPPACPAIMEKWHRACRSPPFLSRQAWELVSYLVHEFVR